MERSKGFLVVSSIVGVFIFVYGTSIILRLLLGDYLMAGGLVDLNFVLLALFCSVPFVLYSMLSTKPTVVILASGFLFSGLFVAVQFALVTMVGKMSQEGLVRILTIIPLTAVLLLFVCHYVINKQQLFIKE